MKIDKCAANIETFNDSLSRGHYSAEHSLDTLVATVRDFSIMFMLWINIVLLLTVTISCITIFFSYDDEGMAHPRLPQFG